MGSTPLLVTAGPRVNREDAPITAARDGPEISGAARAIGIGYCRVGQNVAQMIMAQGASVTVIDSNPEQIERTASFGMKVYYGDGSRVDLLRRAGAEEANLIVYCVNGEWIGASVIEEVRQALPKAAVIARVF